MCCLLSALMVVGAPGCCASSGSSSLSGKRLRWLQHPRAIAGFPLPAVDDADVRSVSPNGVDTVDAIGLVLALVLDIGCMPRAACPGRNRYAQPVMIHRSHRAGPVDRQKFERARPAGDGAHVGRAHEDPDARGDETSEPGRNPGRARRADRPGDEAPLADQPVRRPRLTGLLRASRPR